MFTDKCIHYCASVKCLIIPLFFIIMFQLYLKLFELANQIYRNLPLSLAGVQTALRRWNHLLGVWPEIHNRPVSLPDPVALRLRSPPTGLEQQQQQQQHCHLCHHRTTCGGETTLAPRQTHTRSLHTTWRHRYDKCNSGPHFWLIAFFKAPIGLMDYDYDYVPSY